MFHPIKKGQCLDMKLIRSEEGYRVESDAYPHVLARGKSAGDALAKVEVGILIYEQREYYGAPLEMIVKEAAE